MVHAVTVKWVTTITANPTGEEGLHRGRAINHQCTEFVTKKPSKISIFYKSHYFCRLYFFAYNHRDNIVKSIYTLNIVKKQSRLQK